MPFYSRIPGYTSSYYAAYLASTTSLYSASDWGSYYGTNVYSSPTWTTDTGYRYSSSNTAIYSTYGNYVAAPSVTMTYTGSNSNGWRSEISCRITGGLGDPITISVQTKTGGALLFRRSGCSYRTLYNGSYSAYTKFPSGGNASSYTLGSASSGATYYVYLSLTAYPSTTYGAYLYAKRSPSSSAYTNASIRSGSGTIVDGSYNPSSS